MPATRFTHAELTRSTGRLVLCFCLLGSSLAVTRCDFLVPRQGWSDRWGPLVPHTTFPGDCGLCHVTDSWEVLRKDFVFDHDEETGHPLEGAHASAACLRCHNDRGPVSAYVSRGCGGCHVDPHKSALGLDCSRCHDQETWRPAPLVEEHARTAFPLYGQHLLAPCESCHLRAPVGDFRGAPTSCELCHESDLARATFPDHAANGLVTDCERCHTPIQWGSSTFNHDLFPLLGGHSSLQCGQCHTSGGLSAISPQCYSCHQNDYLRASEHVSRGYPTDCTQCHSIVAWDP